MPIFRGLGARMSFGLLPVLLIPSLAVAAEASRDPFPEASVDGDTGAEIIDIADLHPLPVELSLKPQESERDRSNGSPATQVFPWERLLPSCLRFPTEAEVTVAGGVLSVRGSSAVRRQVREVVERLRTIDRSFRPAAVEVELDVVRCPLSTALELLFRPRDEACVFSEEERRGLLAPRAGELEHRRVASYRLRGVSEGTLEIAGASRSVEGEPPHLRLTGERFQFQALPWSVPGGVRVRLNGFLRIPAPATRRERTDVPKASGLSLRTEVFVPDSRTVLAGIAATSPWGDLVGRRELLLLLVRASGEHPPREAELGAGLRAFNVRELTWPSSAQYFVTWALDPFDPLYEYSIDLDVLRQDVVDSSGGDDAWQGPHRIDPYRDCLIVETPDASRMRAIRDRLDALPHDAPDAVRVAAFWIALDRELARSLVGRSSEPGALSPEALEALHTQLLVGEKAWLLEATGVTADREALVHRVSCGRSDAWDGEDDYTESQVLCAARGPRGSDLLELGLTTWGETRTAAPSEGVSFGRSTRLRVERGQWTLVPGGPTLGNGRSGIYLLLQASWNLVASKPQGSGEREGEDGKDGLEFMDVADLITNVDDPGLFGEQGVRDRRWRDYLPPVPSLCFERDFLLQLLRADLSDDPCEEADGVFMLRDRLGVRGPPEKRARARRFIDALRKAVRSFSPEAMEIELDVVPCEPSVALEILSRSAGGFDDSERSGLVWGRESSPDRGPLVSQTLRCASGAWSDVVGRVELLSLRDSDPSSRGLLQVRATALDRGAHVELAGLVDLPTPTGTSDPESSAPRASRLFLQTSVLVPEGRTAVAGVTGFPTGAAAGESRDVLLLLVRARGTRPAVEANLGRGWHLFDARDILEVIGRLEGPKLELLPKPERKDDDEKEVQPLDDEDSRSLDPDLLRQHIVDSTGGDEVWERPWVAPYSSMELHSGLISVTTQDAALLDGVRGVLRDLRARAWNRVQLSALWIALERDAADSLVSPDEGTTLDRDAIARLGQLLSEGTSARLLDATGLGLILEDSAAEIARGDAWPTCPGKEGEAGGPFLPLTDRPEPEEAGIASVFRVRGDAASPTLELDWLLRAGTVFETFQGHPEVVSLGWSHPLRVENGRWVILSGGPTLGDGRSGPYLLLGVSWSRADSGLKPERSTPSRD